MRKRGQAAEQQATDAALATRAGAGDLTAFEELYRRHVETAWRVALAVTTNPDDAADAVSDAFTRVFQALPDRLHAADHFLPYLLAAVRNAAIDVLRRGGRHQSTEVDEAREWPSLTSGPADVVLAGVDASLVARAFHSLPERWRSVLWLTEVERIPARDAALLLGVSPNGVAQLAVRARAGLRQRYLQAHLGEADVRLRCRDTVERLGAYAAGALAPRDISKVDQHLAGCETCRSRLAQLEDLAPTLRRSVLPLPAGLAALVIGKWRLASSGAVSSAPTAAVTSTTAPAGVGAAGSAAPAVGGVGAGAGAAAAAAVPASLAASVASVALFVAGMVGVGAVNPRPDPAPHAAAPVATFRTAATPTHAAGAPATDPLGRVVDESARAAADLAALPAELGVVLPSDLDGLVPSADLDALAKGRLRVDGADTLIDMDLTGPSPTCRNFKVLGIPIGCPASPAPPAGGDVPIPATAPDPTAVAQQAADTAAAAVASSGAVEPSPGATSGNGLGLRP